MNHWPKIAHSRLKLELKMLWKTLMKNTKFLTKTPLFWSSQVILFFLSLLFVFKFYPKAFLTLDFQIQMDRKQALQEASRLANQHQWGPPVYREAANFDTDSAAQTFIELTAGGNQSLQKIIQEGLYY